MEARGRFGSWRRWAGLVSLVIGLLALVSAAASGGGGSAVSAPADALESLVPIAGSVRGGADASGIENRTVEAINLETGERHSVATDGAGHFTVKVKAGTYRLQVTLRSGESLVHGPGPIQAGPGAAHLHAGFVIVSSRFSRPRSPVYQPAMGLGAPVA